MRYPALLLLALSACLAANAQAADYGLYAGTHIGYGHEGFTGSDTLGDRDVGTFDLQAMPGLHFYGKSLLAGLLFDLRLVSQLNPSNQNLGGTGLLVGPGLVFDFVFGRLMASYDMRDRESIGQPNGTLKGSGFHLLAGYRATPLITLDLQYVKARYNALRVDEVENGLGSQPITHSNISLGISVVL